MCNEIHANFIGAEPGSLVFASYITSGAFTKHKLVPRRYRGVGLQTSTNNHGRAPIDGFAKGSCSVRCRWAAKELTYLAFVTEVIFAMPEVEIVGSGA
jgi:hypothetical protein